MASIEYWNRDFELPPVYRKTRWPNSHLVRALVEQQNQLSVCSINNAQTDVYSLWKAILPESLLSMRITDWESALLELALNAEIAERKSALLAPKTTKRIPVVTVAVRVRLGES